MYYKCIYIYRKQDHASVYGLVHPEAAGVHEAYLLMRLYPHEVYKWSPPPGAIRALGGGHHTR